MKLIERSTEGRIVAIEITKDNQKIFLTNIYAPNEKQKNFFQNLHEMIRRYEPWNVCIAGDFNAIFDKEVDRKSLKQKKKVKANLLKKPFLDLVEEFNLVDVWRISKTIYTLFRKIDRIDGRG